MIRILLLTGRFPVQLYYKINF